MCTPPAGQLRQRDVAEDVISSATAGMPRRPSSHAHEPFVHHAAARQVQVLAVAQHRLVEHPAVFERPPHDLGADDRRAVVGEGDRPALDQPADLGQLLALAALGDAADRKDVGDAGPLRLEDRRTRPAAWLSSAGSVFGMHATLVTPPARAAAVPVAIVSSSSRPGSRRWTCMSIQPGETMRFVASIVRSAWELAAGRPSPRGHR